MKQIPKTCHISCVIPIFLMLFIAGCGAATRPSPRIDLQNAIENGQISKAAKQWVDVKVTPSYEFRFDVMRPGVLQHIDRPYTYDVVPPILMNGLLFQGIHRPPEGTAIRIELFAPADVYFFFHHTEDGGYTAIFSELENWKPSTTFPQYDIHNGSHGLKMVMYRLEADAGTYLIPPTTRDRACFNIVFQSKP